MSTNQTKADLTRIIATTKLLGQLCELSPNAEPISLEQLEVIFKDIAQVCEASLNQLKLTTEQTKSSQGG